VSGKDKVVKKGKEEEKEKEVKKVKKEKEKEKKREMYLNEQRSSEEGMSSTLIQIHLLTVLLSVLLLFLLLLPLLFLAGIRGFPGKDLRVIDEVVFNDLS